MRETDDVGRASRDDRRRGVHDHHRLLGLGRHRRNRERVWSQAEAGEDVDLVAGDHFLRQALGDIGRRAGRVLHDDLDLLTAKDVAVLLEIGFHASQNLRAVVGEGAGEFRNHTDLDDALRVYGAAAEEQHCGKHEPNARDHILHASPFFRSTALGNLCKSPT